MSPALRFLTALLLYRDFHYVRRLLARASRNLRLVLGSLGSWYVRVRPYEDFGGIEPGDSCERLVLGRQPAGLVRVNLIPYHLALAEVEGKVVVDAGTNEGTGAALLATRAREVHAFDRSEEAIGVARERHESPRLHFYVHDADRPFPVPDGSVDVVFSSEMIEHLPAGGGFLAAAARALKPDGVLLLKTPNLDYNRLENRLNRHHRNPYTARRLHAELLRRFEAVAMDGISYETELATRIEDRSSGEPPEAAPYRFGDPIVIDRALEVRMLVRPKLHPGLRPGPAEYLWARARKPRPPSAPRG